MENNIRSEERSYIAFISYRHTPLDREAAERVQKKIENYTVPKEFREQVGGKKLGCKQNNTGKESMGKIFYKQFGNIGS